MKNKSVVLMMNLLMCGIIHASDNYSEYMLNERKERYKNVCSEEGKAYLKQHGFPSRIVDELPSINPNDIKAVGCYLGGEAFRADLGDGFEVNAQCCINGEMICDLSVHKQNGNIITTTIIPIAGSVFDVLKKKYLEKHR